MAKGPAPRGEYVGKSSVFSTRIRPDLRKSLEMAAKRSGRSLSQEVEYSLRRSFIEDEKIADAFGDRRTYRLMRMMADAIDFSSAKLVGAGKHDWLNNPFAFELAKNAIAAVLERVAPEASAALPEYARSAAQSTGEFAASLLWSKVIGADAALPLLKGSQEDSRNSVAKADLADLLDRPLRPVHAEVLRERVRMSRQLLDKAEAEAKEHEK